MRIRSTFFLRLFASRFYINSSKIRRNILFPLQLFLCSLSIVSALNNIKLQGNQFVFSLFFCSCAKITDYVILGHKNNRIGSFTHPKQPIYTLSSPISNLIKPSHLYRTFENQKKNFHNGFLRTGYAHVLFSQKNNKRQSDKSKSNSPHSTDTNTVNGKDNCIQLDGIVMECLPSGTFLVETLEPKFKVLCTISGKIRLHRIRLVRGDKVCVDLNVYDIKHGRISYRYNNPSPENEIQNEE